MSDLARILLDEIASDPVALERLASQLRPFLGAGEPAAPWLNAEEAARHLSCSRGRLYDLVQVGKLTPRRDGRRLLFHRADLDAYLEQGR